MTEERKPYEDTVDKYKDADRQELLIYIQHLEELLKKKNGHKNPAWYKYIQGNGFGVKK